MSDLVVANPDGSYSLANPKRWLRIRFPRCGWCCRELPIDKPCVVTDSGIPTCGFPHAVALETSGVELLVRWSA